MQVWSLGWEDSLEEGIAKDTSKEVKTAHRMGRKFLEILNLIKDLCLGPIKNSYIKKAA